MSREVPEGWTSATLGDVVSLEYGRSLKASSRIPGPIPVYGSNGVVGAHISPAVKGPGIVVGRKGSVGAALWSDVDFWPIDTTYYVVPKGPTNLRWLFYLLLHSRLDKLNQATGVPGLNRGDACMLPILLPPLHEQKKIAEILGSVDESIRATKAVIEQTKKVKKGLLQQLLTRGIGHTRFKQTEIGEIPESWDVVRLEDVVVRATYGFTNPMPTTTNGPWMVTAKDVREGTIDYSTARHTSEEAYRTKITDKSRPVKDDVLVTKDGTLGRIAVVDREGACINQSVALIRPEQQRIAPRFLAAYLESPDGQRRMLDDAGGSTIKHIYITKLTKMAIPLPPLQEQLSIVERSEEARRAQWRLTSSLECCDQLRTGLMQDLLTGIVRVEVTNAQ